MVKEEGHTLEVQGIRKGHTLEVQGIRNGTVIDHIPSNHTLKVVELLSNLEDRVLIGINFESSLMGKKGLVKIANKSFTEEEVSRIAIFAPQATINIIKDWKVVQKVKVRLPSVIEGSFCCPNPRCITNHQRVNTKFIIKETEPLQITCYYCERQFDTEELKLI